MDRRTFDELIVTHLLAVQRFAICLSGDVHDAEEIVQEALLRAARRWQSFRGESAFQTWLFQIVVNAFRDHRSARPKPEELPGELADRKWIDPAAQASAADLGEFIALAVSTLPPRQREVLVLHAYQHQSMAEIAAILGVSEQNARTNLALARKRLRETLGIEVNGEV